MFSPIANNDKKWGRMTPEVHLQSYICKATAAIDLAEDDTCAQHNSVIMANNVLCEPWHISPLSQGLLRDTSRHDFVVPVGIRAVNIIIFVEQLIPVSFFNHLTCLSKVCILVPPN